MKHRREVRLVLDHFHEVLHLEQNQPPWEPASVFCKVWKTGNEDSEYKLLVLLFTLCATASKNLC